jgi:glutathione S-transferase
MGLMSNTLHPKMYDKPECPFCWKVRLAMHIAQFSCEFIFVDTKNKPPELMSLNPTGTVPVLLVDKVIAGSDSILDYVYETTGHSVLRPNEASETLHQYANQVLGRGTKDWIFTHRDTPQELWQKDVLDAAQHAWFSALDDLENQCMAEPWFLGNSPTLADCALFPRFAIAMHYGIGDLSKHPRLNRWFQTIQDSNIYVKTAPANFLN